MNYFYARVSTVQQNEARQLDAAKRAGISDKYIFVDKESGKDFDRTNWRLLTERLTKGDVLFVKSIDRIGRNYKEIIRVWQTLTKDREIDVVVLDMPLLDTRKEKNLLGTFVADIVLQILSFVAENERAHILERQREGIAAAKERGVVFGRKSVELPDGFEEVARDYLAGRIGGADASATVGMTHSTFRKYARRLGPKTKNFYTPRPKRERPPLPDGFEEIAKRWFRGEIVAKQAAAELGWSDRWFKTRARELFPGQKSLARPTPRTEVDEAFKKIALAWFDGKISCKQAGERLGVGENTFSHYARLAFPDLPSPTGRLKKRLPKGFVKLAKAYFDGETTAKEAAEELGMSAHMFYRYVKLKFPGRDKRSRVRAVVRSDRFKEVVKRRVSGETTGKEAAAELGMSTSTYYKYETIYFETELS